MKSLYIVRHAKSSWKNNELKDIERPLKHKGEKNALFMAKFLKRNNEIPDQIITSPAVRAYETAKIFAEKFDLNSDSLVKDEKLYMADYDDFIAVLGNVKKKTNKLMIIGHNPGLTYFVCAITGADIDNIPTCGVVKIDFDFEEWPEIQNKKGKLIFFEYPKKYDIDNNLMTVVPNGG